MILLTRSGLRVSGGPGDLHTLRSQFDRQHCIQLPRLLDASVLAFLDEAIPHAEFANATHPKVGVELRMRPNAALSLLQFLANDPGLFELVQQITGCDRIGSFMGRVYRMAPGAGHHCSWHSDHVDHRMVGMSINLGTQVYAGGVLHLREADSQRSLCEAVNTGCGDAILFRIAKHLEHMVTPLEGAVAKTAFAGWFVSEPDFMSLLTLNSADHASRDHTNPSALAED